MIEILRVEGTPVSSHFPLICAKSTSLRVGDVSSWAQLLLAPSSKVLRMLIVRFAQSVILFINEQDPARVSTWWIWSWDTYVPSNTVEEPSLRPNLAFAQADILMLAINTPLATTVPALTLNRQAADRWVLIKSPKSLSSSDTGCRAMNGISSLSPLVVVIVGYPVIRHWSVKSHRVNQWNALFCEKLSNARSVHARRLEF